MNTNGKARTFVWILGIVVAVLVASGGWLLMTKRGAVASRPNVILISIDTCRPDYLGCYGEREGLTPHIDAVAGESVRFDSVISSVPLTLPSHCSMLTGTIPPRHGVHDNINYRLAEDNVTLAEHFRDHGYQTAAFVAAFVLDSRFGLAQGFETYDDHLDASMTITGGYPERRGDEVTRAATAWLDSQGEQPFFLFVHYFDPHDPYQPPEPFASNFADDPYAGEIAYTDQCIGTLIARLKDLDLYDSSLVIITGDHGESLGEHGENEHGFFIYHSTTRVPLIIKTPYHQRQAVVSQTVGVIDIAPTLSALAGLEPPKTMQGRDLSVLLTGQKPAPEQRFLYSESLTASKYGCSPLLGVQDDHWKYIQTSESELYDLASDPHETMNVIAEHPTESRYMREQLSAILRESLRTRGDDTHVALDPSSLASLRQLGYVGGPVVENFEFETDKPDPKSYIAFYPYLERLDLLVDQRQYDQARRLCAELLEARPDFAYVYGKLGRIAVEQHSPEEAMAHFQDALRLNPDSDLWHNNLAVLLVRQGRLEEAVEHFREALRAAGMESSEAVQPGRALGFQGRMDSSVFNTYLNLGNTLLRLGRFEEALEACRSAVRINPDDANAHYHVGLALQNLGQEEPAIEAFDEALRLDPNHAGAHRARESISSHGTDTGSP